jgi:hypothetical protein
MSAYSLAEDVCPVGDELLGDLYRSHERGLADLVASVAPDVRATLALFCYRRGHLHSMGLAIAASCSEEELVNAGGRVGAVLFALSREAPQAAPVAPHQVGKRKITLASGPLRVLPPLDDIEDDA